MEQLHCRRIILTGNPRVGKTTIVRKTISAAKKRNLILTGIITPEIREGGRRKGFQIVDLRSGEKGILASVASERSQPTQWRVGKYRVHQESLKEIAIPAIQEAMENPRVDLVIIDEIGKMEVLDANFAALATEALRNETYRYSALATLGRGIPRSIRARLELETIEKIHVEVSNRDYIAKDLQKWVSKK
ncbi:MAG: nucleoside-triphosphatase [Candidatus Thorarchaeota archaeon]